MALRASCALDPPDVPIALAERKPNGTMKMRLLILSLLAALLVPAGVWAQGGAARKTASSGLKPVIEIPTTSHDFGEVYKQDKFAHAFTVYNRGNADLVIEEVKPG
jgi:Protein of unknown function (DUF1573)